MRRSLNGLQFSLTCVVLALPALGQQAGADKPNMLVWLTCDLGRGGGCIGVVISRQYKALGKVDLKCGTTVVAPDGSEWDLSSATGFIKFPNDKTIVASSTGRLEDATFRQIGAYQSFSIRIDARQYLRSGEATLGSKTFNVQLSGFVAMVRGGSYGAEPQLLPTEDFYSAKGTIVTSVKGLGEETEDITGTVLGLVNGKMTLGLSASTPAGQVSTS
jgi:hypothetical protein